MSRLRAFAPNIERLQGIPPAALAIASAVAVVALSGFAIAPLFGEGMILTGDNLHAWRLSAMHACIDDGQIPCRWAAELGNGYGLPLFNFYPPLPYYTGDVLHRAGLSYLNTVDALFIIGLAGAGLSMFVLGRALWGNLGGIVSATAYVYAPYLALDTYMRGALGELWALAVAPALFWAVYRLIATAGPRYMPAVALFTGLLLLSHSLATLIVLPMVAIWALGLLLTHGVDAWRAVILGALGAAWGFGLAAFFSLPVLVEGDDVQLENTTSFPFRYESHFTTVGDLFLERSADYSALVSFGSGAGTPIQIGWFHWALAGLAIPAAALLFLAGRRAPALAIVLLGGFFAAGVYMSVSASESIWDTYDALHYLQFPWRYVGLVTLAAAALAGAWLAVLRGQAAGLQLIVAAALVGLFIGSGEMYFAPAHRCTVEADRLIPCPGSDEEYFSDGPYRASEQGSIRDYLPVAVEVIPAPAGLDVFVVGDAGPVTDVERESDRLSFEVDAAAPVEAQVAIFDYPTWTVHVDGEEIEHAATEPNGIITFEVPAGQHEVDVRLGSTDTARVANLISLASWVALAIALQVMLVSALLGRRRAEGAG